MRLYVTGGTGLVGSNIIRLARQESDIDIIASQYGPEPEWQVDYALDPLDLRDLDSIRRTIHNHKPDVVIHTAILLDLLFLTKNRELAWTMTVDATRTLAEACRDVGARLIFVSSDWVFDGTQTLVTEESPPLPVNYYGFMKAISERDLGAMDGMNYAVARMAGIYGCNYAIPGLTRREQGLGFEIAGYVAQQILKKKVATIWTGPSVNDVAHATLASDGADLLLRLARHDAMGIFHCFGSEAINRLDFAYAIVDAFGADRSLIAAVPTDADVLADFVGIRIPYRIRASVEKSVTVLGRMPLNIGEGVARFQQEWLAQYGN